MARNAQGFLIPSVKPYVPKPTSAGQSVTVEGIGAIRANWLGVRPDPGASATGTVWSAGPVASSVWVVLDGGAGTIAAKVYKGVVTALHNYGPEVAAGHAAAVRAERAAAAAQALAA